MTGTASDKVVWFPEQSEGMVRGTGLDRLSVDPTFQCQGWQRCPLKNKSKNPALWLLLTGRVTQPRPLYRC